MTECEYDHTQVAKTARTCPGCGEVVRQMTSEYRNLLCPTCRRRTRHDRFRNPNGPDSSAIWNCERCGRDNL
jgi:hypothetical protein